MYPKRIETMVKGSWFGVEVPPPGTNTSRDSRRLDNFLFELHEYGIKVPYDFASNGQCGPGFCNETDACVTWVKERPYNDSQEPYRNSPLMVHECRNKEVTTSSVSILICA